VTSADLTPEQLDRLRRAVQRHRDYYHRLAARMLHIGIPIGDPLADAVSDAWAAASRLARAVDALASATPDEAADLGASWEVLKTLGLGKHGRK
jgi:hypothetical protein